MSLKFSILASSDPEAQKAKRDIKKLYSTSNYDEADIIVALGGDGYMLQTLHKSIKNCLPIFGMNKGTVGFLMNEYRTNNLLERLETAEALSLHPLRVKIKTNEGIRKEVLAINEVSLLRETRQAANIKIHVDGKVRLEELISDGIMVATPAGSTAYNLSAHGPILPLGSNLLALTPISAFRPRRWRGALLPHTSHIKFEVSQADKRPVSAVADMVEIRNVQQVEIKEDQSVSLNLLFDPDHNLAERILMEQFIS
ncbi:MAG: NAD kinase [Sphingomonadales bacterium]